MQKAAEKYIIHDWVRAMQGQSNDEQLFLNLAQAYPPLTSVTFTRQCNLRCKHCIYPVCNQTDIELTDMQRIDAAIEATKNIGVADLIHVGRTLRVEHLPILKKYQDRGMILNLIDNGSGARLVDQMKNAGIFFDGEIDVSIDGDKSTHEHQRGKGAWNMAIEGAKNLKQVADHVSITATASALNYRHILRGFDEMRKELPSVKIFQVTTTAPAHHHQQQMAMESSEMFHLFKVLLSNLAFPTTLAIYRVEDIAPLLTILSTYPRPQPKFCTVEWQIDQLTIIFSPQSIVTSEEFAIDANGRHILPFGLDWHLNDRPNDWEMRDDLILSDPKKSYQLLVHKYRKTFGKMVLQQEKKVFKNFF